MWWAWTTRLQLSTRLSEHWLGATSALWWGFAWGFKGDPLGRGKVGARCAYLKCSEPFLETRRWLDWGDASSLLALTVGCSDVAKRGGCGWTWDNSCWAVRPEEGTFQVKQRALVMNIHWVSSMLYIYSWIAKRKAESPFHYWFIFNGRREGEGVGFMSTCTVKCLFLVWSLKW